MHRIFRIATIIISSLALLGTALLGYIYLNRTIIKNYLFEQLNHQLVATITIRESEVTMWANFPKISIDLKGVEISDLAHSKIPLLSAHHVYLGFNIFDLITQNYKIQQIIIDSGILNIRCNKKGQFNFKILKMDSISDSKNVFVNLEEVVARNSMLTYIDYQSKQDYQCNLSEVFFGGMFSPQTENFYCKGSMFIVHLRSGDLTLIQDKKSSLNLGATYDSEKKVISIIKCNFSVEDLFVEVKGDVQNSLEKTLVDLKFTSKELSLQHLLTILPIKTSASEAYEGTGKISFSGFAKGVSSTTDNPQFFFDFYLDRGTLVRKKDKLAISDVKFTGTFTNGARHLMSTSVIDIHGFSLRIRNSNMSGNLHIEGFSNPYITANLNGSFMANDLKELFKPRNIKCAEGNLQFELKLKGHSNDLSDPGRLSRTNMTGSAHIDFHQIQFERGSSVDLVQSLMVMKEGELNLISALVRSDKSDISIHGKIVNFVPVVFSGKGKMNVEIESHSTFLNFADFIIPSTSADTTENGFKLPETVTVKAHMKIDKCSLNEFNAANLTMKMVMDGHELSIEEAQMNAMSGSIELKGKVENSNDGRLLITSSTKLKNISINELFREMGNFGQKEITNNEVNGTLNATIDLASVWNHKLECDLPRLYAFGDIEILNGTINGYKPLEGLSKFADVEDLRHLRFADLRNKIEIKKKSILIPAMDIHSNALNLSISGTQSFDNILDYRLRIRLSELLKKKRKQSNNEFGEEEDNSGGLFIYLTMKGPVDKLKFNYDKVSVKNKIKQDLQVERKNIGDVLRKELGIRKDTTIREKKTESEELEFEKE